ncbi:MAG: hypothetical protein LBQ87_10300 [Candidatus Fibromonas sp.]|nr:hypothetical protein [Candidatus Fibromonas sp.]
MRILTLTKTKINYAHRIFFYITLTMNIRDTAKEPVPQAWQKDPAGQAGRV